MPLAWDASDAERCWRQKPLREGQHHHQVRILKKLRQIRSRGIRLWWGSKRKDTKSRGSKNRDPKSPIR